MRLEFEIPEGVIADLLVSAIETDHFPRVQPVLRGKNRHLSIGNKWIYVAATGNSNSRLDRFLPIAHACNFCQFPRLRNDVSSQQRTTLTN